MKYLLSAYCLSLVVLLAGCDSGPRKAAADTAGGREQPVPPVAVVEEPAPQTPTAINSVSTTPNRNASGVPTPLPAATAPPPAAPVRRLPRPAPKALPTATVVAECQDTASVRAPLSAEKAATGLAALYADCAKQAQVYQIEASTDTILVGAEGTRVMIPPDVFVDSVTGKPIKGAITVTLAEYLTLADIVLNNLSTTSGDELLETAGMVRISASANGRPVKLKPRAQLIITLPRSGAPKPGMQTFVGQPVAGSRRIDWQVPVEQVKPAWQPRWRGININFPPIYIPGNDRVERALKRKAGFTSKWAQAVFWNNSDSEPIAKEPRRIRSLRRRFHRRGLIDRFEVTFIVDPNGMISHVKVKGGVEPGAQAAIAAAVRQLQPWRPGFVFRRTLVTAGPITRVPIRWQERIHVEIRKSGRVKITNWRNQIPKGLRDTLRLQASGKLPINAADTVAQAPANAYVLFASTTGWYNCDQFVTPQSRTVLAGARATRCSMRVAVPDTDVKLVFRNFRTVLDGRYQNAGVSFQSIPVDEPATILAIRREGEQLLLATQEVQTSRQTVSDLSFRPVTLPELRAELQKLDR